MNKFLVLAAVGTTLIAVTPASAQVSFGIGPNGFGVQVGPNTHNYNNWRDRDFRGSYAYGGGYGNCETVRERTVNRRGQVVYSTHRVCD